MGHMRVTVLILGGSGWTGQYLIEECKRSGVSCAGTSTDGRNGMLPFKFDETSTDPQPFDSLPSAETVVITFPLNSEIAAERLTSFYSQTHPTISNKLKWILLGSTSSFGQDPNSPWIHRRTPITNVTARNKGEARLLSLHPTTSTVLHLSGLYDAKTRNPRNFLARIAPSKESVAARLSVHYIHGQDVARAILAVHTRFRSGETRWIISNMRVYDWWEFIGGNLPTGWDLERHGVPETWTWVLELMRERNVCALPRSVLELNRALDSREFWEVHGLMPLHSQL